MKSGYLLGYLGDSTLKNVPDVVVTFDNETGSFVPDQQRVICDPVNDRVTPTISIYSSPDGTINYGDPVTFTAVVTFPGNNPIFRWLVNGSDVGVGLPTMTSYTLVAGDTVVCSFASNDPDALPSPNDLWSNPMTVVSASPGFVVIIGTL